MNNPYADIMPQEDFQPSAPQPVQDATRQPNISGSFVDTIKNIEINRVLYGASPGKNDPFKGEWPGSERNCGGFTTCAINRALKATGVPEDKLLPKSNLGTGQPKFLSEKFGTPLVNQFNPGILRQMGVGTVIAGTKPGGGTHAEMIVAHPVTGEMVVASYGRQGKTIQYKQIDDNYTSRLNAGKFSATNPFMSSGTQIAQSGGGLGGPGRVSQQPGGGFLSQGMNFFIQRGYSPAQAAGIVGNLMHESGGKIDIAGDSGKSVGLAQWQGGRLKALRKFAGTDKPSLQDQLAFIDYELNTSETKALRALKGANTPEEAARLFSQLYERPGKPMLNERVKYAQQAMTAFSMGQAQSMTADLSMESGRPAEPTEEPKSLLSSAADLAKRILEVQRGSLDDE